ncbi:hypothetical protein [Streptomyces hygroscopicus]|uniref:hypothetical protein n=1 Tax=Streptomyces hygroscopicus TaxID=1912 RepID=UPI00223EDBA2|nr:hypothetical protein [Streptomyces hygroscopicus]
MLKKPSLPSKPAQLATGATVVLARATIAATTQPPAHQTERHRASTRITVVEHAETDTVADTGRTGDRLGDLLAFGNPLYDATGRHQIATDQGSCIRTQVAKV